MLMRQPLLCLTICRFLPDAKQLSGLLEICEDVDLVGTMSQKAFGNMRGYRFGGHHEPEAVWKYAWISIWWAP